MNSSADPLIEIVDDDAAMRDSLAELAASQGWHFRCHADPESILALASDDFSGCILLDMRMPRLSGTEVFRRLIGKGITKPVIFMTAYGDIPMAITAIRDGAFDFVEKPFCLRTLCERVRAALAIYEERRNRPQPGSAVAGSLSSEERLLAVELANGATNKTLAAKFGVSMRTIQFRRARLMKTFGVGSKMGLLSAIQACLETRAEPAAIDAGE